MSKIAPERINLRPSGVNFYLEGFIELISP